MRFEYTQYWDKHKRLRPRTDHFELTHEDPDDFIMRVIRESSSFYEVELLEYAAACGPRGGCFIDVGANIGNHTVYFAKFLADTVIAIEPALSAQRSLQRNITLNNLNNCLVVPCAAGEKCSDGEVYLLERHRRIKNSSGMRVIPHLGGQQVTEQVALRERISVRPLDAIVDEHQSMTASGSVSLIKLDVEGMELSVLKGAQRVLAQHTPDVCAEVWNESQQTSISQFLSGFGYSCQHLTRVESPTCWFVHETRRKSRRKRSWLTRKVVSSWSRGRLKALRSFLS